MGIVRERHRINCDINLIIGSNDNGLSFHATTAASCRIRLDSLYKEQEDNVRKIGLSNGFLVGQTRGE